MRLVYYLIFKDSGFSAISEELKDFGVISSKIYVNDKQNLLVCVFSRMMNDLL